jgi:hypothetical protein
VTKREDNANSGEERLIDCRNTGEEQKETIEAFLIL